MSLKDKRMFQSVKDLMNEITTKSDERHYTNGQATIILAGAEALYFQKGAIVYPNYDKWDKNYNVINFDIEFLKKFCGWGSKIKENYKKRKTGSHKYPKNPFYSMEKTERINPGFFMHVAFAINSIKEMDSLFEKNIDRIRFIHFLEENKKKLPDVIFYIAVNQLDELTSLLDRLTLKIGYDKKNIHFVWPQNGFYNRRSFHALELMQDKKAAKKVTENAMHIAAVIAREEEDYNNEQIVKKVKAMNGYFIKIPDTKNMEEFTIIKESGKPFSKNE